MNWLTEIWTWISDIVNATGSNLDTLVSRIDNVQFNSDFAITKFLSLIHYILGSPLYQMFTILMEIGCGFILWKLIKIVINAISNVIPGLKGKVKVE